MSAVPDALLARMAAQAERLPGMYGRLDFSTLPERYTEDPAVPSVLDARWPGSGRRRAQLLANRPMVERIRAYTLLGDPVADAYAALIPRHGFRQLVDWLVRACDQGLNAVPEAPPELRTFIDAMARVPDWLDRDLIEQGARASRPGMAYIAPLVLRGAFFATFTNKYAALPMALTGALGHDTAARRVMETATFFTVTTLPGALQRHGPGFKAAAMVRLMHSMVRFHALGKPGLWDTAVYGLPIPQVDQMPAGLIGPYLIARRTLRRGQQRFNPADRAQIELARYRCFLLGLPEDLLPDTPQAMVDIMDTRSATLRDGFDDATCGALLRATMAADLGRDPGWLGGLAAAVEPSVARLYFLRNFLGGDRARAAAMGVPIGRRDTALALVGVVLVAVPAIGHALARRVPGLRDVADRALVRRLQRLLQRYGHADFQSDAAQYRPNAGGGHGGQTGHAGGHPGGAPARPAAP